MSMHHGDAEAGHSLASRLYDVFFPSQYVSLTSLKLYYQTYVERLYALLEDQNG